MIDFESWLTREALNKFVADEIREALRRAAQATDWSPIFAEIRKNKRWK